MSKIAFKPGSVVEGVYFFGREKELNDAWEKHLLHGTSLLLSAPRRVGKTSFSKKMLEIAGKNGWKTLYLDLEGINTESAFVKSFKEEWQKQKWWENVKSKIGDTTLKFFDSIKELEIAGNKLTLDVNAWRSDTYGKIRQLIESPGEILIVIDELTIYLDNLIKQENGKEKAEFFLEWLRSFRQTTQVRWILCSSIGIENFASRHQLSKHLNDLYSFPIGAFTENEARNFISRLAVDEKVQFTQEHIQYILEKLAWYLPYFIQIFIYQINDLVGEGRQLCNETIDEAWNYLISGIHLNQWGERLKEYQELEKDARKILKLCAQDGRSRDDLLANLFVEKSDIEKTEDNLAQLLYMLQNDGYLIKHDGKYIFRSPLLRDFWYNRYIG